MAGKGYCLHFCCSEWILFLSSSYLCWGENALQALLLNHPDLIHCQFSTTTILGLSPSNFTIIVDISITFYRKSLLLPSPKYILSIYLSRHTCTHTTGRFMKAFHQTPTIESLFTCSLGIEFRTSQARQTRYHWRTPPSIFKFWFWQKA